MVKKESVTYHVTSALHKESLAKSALEKKERNEATPLQESVMKMEESVIRNMEKLFITAYHVVIYECPFTDFPNFLISR